jgi:hypothetical protein
MSWGVAFLIALLLTTTVFGARFLTNSFVEQRLTGRTQSGAVAVGDQTQYLSLARYFRGEPRPPDLVAPFAYRVLPSFLAARMPGQARTNFIVLNFGSVVVAAMFIFALVTRLGLGARAATVGTGLYVLSFPVFYYGTDALTDPMATSFLTVALWAVFDGRWVSYLLAVSLGVLCRETDMAAVLAFAAWQLTGGRRHLPRLLLGVVIPFVVLALPRVWFADLSHGRSFINTATFEVLVLNVTRPRTYLTILLTLWFVPVAVGWYLLRKNRRAATVFPTPDATRYVQLMAAVLVLIPLYAMAAAYSDGRFFWVLYPAVIPFALGCLRAGGRGRIGAVEQSPLDAEVA